MHTYTYTHIYMYTHIHIHIRTHIHIYIHIYIYTYIYIYIYICTCNQYFRFSSFINFTICFSLSKVIFSSNISSYSSISYFKYNSFSFLLFLNKCSSTSCSFLHRGNRISCLYIYLYIYIFIFIYLYIYISQIAF